ncbi:MAG: SDR family NAD(P)-dependent oxidoreductase [Sneathiella sp.]
MKKSKVQTAMTGDEIAIVGSSIRLPNGCNNLEDYWRVLVDGEDLITEVSNERWNVDAYYYPGRDIPGKSYTKSAGQLDNLWDFDASFFNISPREAAQLDPQQRLLLELSWEAFENAGIKPSLTRGSDTSVYVGISSNDYGNSKISDLASGNSFFMLGTTMSLASNRLSYFYDFQGSSLSVDTACSSSLYALDLACQKIRSGDSDMALCGGVSVLLTPYPFVGFSQANMLSEDGRCMAFDSRGNGYVRSEGGGIFVLKRLKNALEDGNPVHAIIAGVGTNADGRTNGISLPSTDRQEALLRKVYKSAKIEPKDLTYIEAHGTGTVVGDAAEVGAIGRFFGPHRSPTNKLPIGSAKTNVGHLEAGSGMAGLVKAALVVKNGTIPKSVHLQKQRDDIPFDEYNIEVASETSTIKKSDNLITVGVNSFGFGGANGHAVIQQYRSDTKIASLPLHKTAKGGGNTLPPLFLSARSDRSLNDLAAKYLDYIESSPDAEKYIETASAAYHYRESFENRLAVTGKDVSEITSSLAAFLDDGSPYQSALQGQADATPKPIAFVFNGNGAQYPGMAKDLIAGDPVFKEWVERIDALIQSKAGWSVLDAIENADDEKINDTTIAQPLIMTIQIALVEYLKSFGIRPAASFGHSVGEIAAAYAAGILNLDQAVDVILKRSNAQGKTRGAGSMAAMEMDADKAAALLESLDLDIVLAGFNGPTSVTLSGNEDDLYTLRDYAKENSIAYKKLDLDYAFHSPAMDRIETEIKEELASIAPVNSVIPFISTVTGELIDGEKLDADYWWQNIRKPVQFRSGIEKAWEQGCRLFLEIGPKSILQSYIRNTTRQETTDNCAIRFLSGKNDLARLVEMPGQIFVLGGEIDISAFLPKGPFPADLPSYPWDKQTHKLALTSESNGGIDNVWDHPLLGERGKSALGEWTLNLGARNPSFLMDHKVAGSIVFPAAGFVEMALAASRSLHGDDGQAIENLEIHVPLVLEEKTLRTIRFEVNSEDGSFTIRSRPYLGDGDGITNATGRISQTISSAKNNKLVVKADELEGNQLSSDEFYPFAKTLGLDYGPAFQGLKWAQAGSNTLIAQLVLPETNLSKAADYILHPSLMDSCLQALFVLLQNQSDLPANAVYLPSVFGRITVYKSGETEITCKAKLKRISSRSVIADFVLEDKDGNLVATLTECRFRKFESASVSATPSRYAQTIVPIGNSLGSTALLSIEDLLLKVRDIPSSNTDDFDTYREEILPLTEALTSAFAFKAISELGGDFESGLSIEDFMASAALDIDQRHFLEYLIHIMEEDELIFQSPTGWKINEHAEIYNPADIWRLILRDHPETLPEMTLLGRSGVMLPNILKGITSPDDLAFTSGTAIPKFAAENSNLTRLMEDETNTAVKQLVDHYDSPNRLRILELDGHNILSAQSLLSYIESDKLDYIFTSTDSDIVHRAQKDIGAINGVSCRLLDDLTAQTAGVLQSEFGSFDIIITRGTPWNPPKFEAISYLSRQLLAKNGKLLVAQCSEGRLANLIAGGNSEWWNRTISGQKPTPLSLSSTAWVKHLEAGNSFKAAVLLEKSETYFENGFVLVAEQLNEQIFENEEDPSEITSTQKGTTLFIANNAEEETLAAKLAITLSEFDHLIVSIQETTGSLSQNQFGLKAFDKPEFDLLAQHLMSQEVPVLRIVHLAGLLEKSENLALEIQHVRCASLISALQAFEREILPQKPLLHILTRGSQFLNEHTPSPLQAPLWGLGRVIANEYPDLQCKLIDIAGDQIDIAALSNEILAEDRENEVILDNTSRFGTRLRPIHAEEENTHVIENAGLNFRSPGALENLAWFEKKIPEPASDEICINMRATGLNFRDVMWAMGVLKDEAVENGYAGPTLGMEGSGVITAIGADVEGFKIGDRVMCFASDCFSQYLCTKTTAVTQIPENMSFCEAATIPSVFLTIYYALEHLARLQPGERVLIHGAAGGVGLAAIQYAKHIGAEIFVTAGSDEKRDFLKLQGIDNIFDSRSLDFADQIMEQTGGDGIDVVLNSLSGDAIGKNLSILKPFGRFLELGKRDFYADSKMGLRPFRNNITYYGIDADQLMAEKPALSSKLFKEMMALFEQEVLTPLVHSSFQQSQITEAFRTMQQSRHIGKIVVSMEDLPSSNIIPMQQEAQTDTPIDGVCIVTGGLGGFGLATAKWLSNHKFSQFVLMGRSGVKTEADQLVIDQMIKDGVQVDIVQVDVTDRSVLEQALQTVRDTARKIKGVVHCAMVLDDGMISNIEPDRLRNVLAPKITGAWNLHELTLNDPVEMFLLYSSATTYIGNPGQAAYVAGNSYLEALADLRKSQNLPATTIAWGAIEDVGVLSANENVKEILTKRTGLRAMPADTAMLGLAETLNSGEANCAVLQLNWSNITNGFAAGAKARYDDIRHLGDATDSSGSTDDILAELQGKTEEEALNLILGIIIKQISSITGSSPDRISPKQSLFDLGIDSLMALELTMELERRFGVELSSMSIIGAGNISDLAAKVVGLLLNDDLSENNQGEMQELISQHGLNMDDGDIADVLEQAGSNH